MIRLGDFYIPFLHLEMSPKLKVNEVSEVKYTIEQMGLTKCIEYSIQQKCKIYEIFLKTEHVLGHKQVSLKKRSLVST